MLYPEEWDPDVRTVTDFLSYRQPLNNPADAIFVFGHYLPQVPQHALELWQQKMAPIILISGYGHDRLPPGMRSEVHYYQTLLVNEGVPPEEIILEEKASNTLENVRFGL